MKKIAFITILSNLFSSVHACPFSSPPYFTQKLNGFTYRVYYENYYISSHGLMGRNLIINPLKNSLSGYEECPPYFMHSVSCYNTLFMYSDFEIGKVILKNQHHFNFRYQEEASDYPNAVILKPQPINIIKSTKEQLNSPMGDQK